MEARLDNGLIIGHAYSITDVRLVSDACRQTGFPIDSLYITAYLLFFPFFFFKILLNHHRGNPRSSWQSTKYGNRTYKYLQLITCF